MPVVKAIHGITRTQSTTSTEGATTVPAGRGRCLVSNLKRSMSDITLERLAGKGCTDYGEETGMHDVKPVKPLAWSPGDTSFVGSPSAESMNSNSPLRPSRSEDSPIGSPLSAALLCIDNLQSAGMEPWYLKELRKKQGIELDHSRMRICVNACRAEVVMLCKTCDETLCRNCGDEHSVDFRLHDIIAVHDKQMSILKTEGWKVRTLMDLGMGDDDTIANLSKSFVAAKTKKAQGPKVNKMRHSDWLISLMEKLVVRLKLRRKLVPSTISSLANRAQNPDVSKKLQANFLEETVGSTTSEEAVTKHSASQKTGAQECGSPHPRMTRAKNEVAGKQKKSTKVRRHQALSEEITDSRTGMDMCHDEKVQNFFDIMDSDQAVPRMQRKSSWGSSSKNFSFSMKNLSDEQASARAAERTTNYLQSKIAGATAEARQRRGVASFVTAAGGFGRTQSCSACTSTAQLATDDVTSALADASARSAPAGRSKRLTTVWQSMGRLNRTSSLHLDGASPLDRSPSNESASTSSQGGKTPIGAGRFSRTSSNESTQAATSLQGGKTPIGAGRFSRTSSNESTQADISSHGGKTPIGAGRLSRTSSNESMQFEGTGSSSPMGRPPRRVTLGTNRLSRTGSVSSGTDDRDANSEASTSSTRKAASPSVSSDISLQDVSSTKATGTDHICESRTETESRVNPWHHKVLRAQVSSDGPAISSGLSSGSSRSVASLIDSRSSPVPSLVASGIGAPGISRTPSSAALNRINASLDQVESNCVRGLLYVEYGESSLYQQHTRVCTYEWEISISPGRILDTDLLGENPMCCFCEISEKHLTISGENKKMMYKVPLLDIGFELCKGSSTRMVLGSRRPTDRLRKFFVAHGLKRQFDQGRCVLVARDQKEIQNWYRTMSDRVKELEKSTKTLEEQYDFEDLTLFTFNLSPGSTTKLQNLSSTGPLAQYNGKECVIRSIKGHKIKVEVGSPIKYVNVNPANLGGILVRGAMSRESKQKIQKRLARFRKMLELKYAGAEVPEEEEEEEEEEEDDFGHDTMYSGAWTSSANTTINSSDDEGQD